MRNFFETVDRKLRANQKRKDAQACADAGYPVIAQINWEEAAILDPIRYDEDPEALNQR